jgi:hypothetical protein
MYLDVLGGDLDCGAGLAALLEVLDGPLLGRRGNGLPETCPRLGPCER